MKRIAIIFCSLIILSVGLTVSARAQEATQYRVNIAFDFNVGNKVFEAGDYVVALTNSGQNVLTIRNAKSGEEKLVLIMQRTANEAIESSKLVFNRYDDQYYLAEMISPTINAEFRKTKDEERLAKLQKSKREAIALKK